MSLSQITCRLFVACDISMRTVPAADHRRHSRASLPGHMACPTLATATERSSTRSLTAGALGWMPGMGRRTGQGIRRESAAVTLHCGFLYRATIPTRLTELAESGAILPGLSPAFGGRA